MMEPLFQTCDTRYRIVVVQNTRPKLPGTESPDKQPWWVCKCNDHLPEVRG